MQQWNEAQWAQRCAPYGRDYGWLRAAAQQYGGQVQSLGVAVGVFFAPRDGQDLGAQYGLEAGQTLCFLLEAAAERQPTAVREKLPRMAAEHGQETLLAKKEPPCLFAVPVASGRAALGWQLGLRLQAIRPLVLLRPFYLFRAAGALPTHGELCCVPLADTHRLGCLLDSGWVGISERPATQEAVLQRGDAADAD